MADQVESEKIVNKINLKDEMVSSGVSGVLEELDNELIGLEPVKT